MRVREVRLDEIGLIKEDTPYPWVRYVGRSDSIIAADTDPVWQILRVTKEGSVVTSTYANKGSFVCTWTDRASYFPPVATSYIAYQANMGSDFTSDVISLGTDLALSLTVSWSGNDAGNGTAQLESSSDGICWCEYPNGSVLVTLVPGCQSFDIPTTGMAFFRVVYSAGANTTGLMDISYTTKGSGKLWTVK